jgi:signal transduction histidine kinase
MLLDSGKAVTKEVGEILNDIEKDAVRAGDVIERVRGLVRRQALHLEAVDGNTVVSDVVKIVSEEAAERRVEIVTRLSGESGRVAGDRTQLVEVLLNLVTNGMNAMEATPLLERRLTLQTAQRDGDMTISVRDCGGGIPQEAMAQLFEPFFTTRKEGMGLGLAIAKSIVEAHRGRIWAENNAEGGATFSVSLPIAISASFANATTAAA